MSKTNDTKPPRSTSSSTVKNLFRQSEQQETPVEISGNIQSPDQAEENMMPKSNETSASVQQTQTNAPNQSQFQQSVQSVQNENISPGYRSKVSFFSRLKKGWNNLLEAMRQQPEAEDGEYEDGFEEEFTDSSSDYTGTFKHNYRNNVSHNESDSQQDKNNLFKKLRLDNFEASLSEIQPLSEEESPTKNDISRQNDEIAGNVPNVKEYSSEVKTDRESVSVEKSDTKPDAFTRTENDTAAEAETEKNIFQSTPATEAIATNDSVKSEEAVTNKSDDLNETKPEKRTYNSTENVSVRQNREIISEEKTETVLPDDPEVASGSMDEEISNYSDNVIYSVPSQSKPAKTQATTRAPAVIDNADKPEPQKPADERFSKELPAFDIFAEFAKEQKSGNTIDSSESQKKTTSTDHEKASDEKTNNAVQDESVTEQRSENKTDDIKPVQSSEAKEKVIASDGNTYPDEKLTLEKPLESETSVSAETIENRSDTASDKKADTAPKLAEPKPTEQHSANIKEKATDKKEIIPEKTNLSKDTSISKSNADSEHTDNPAEKTLGTQITVPASSETKKTEKQTNAAAPENLIYDAPIGEISEPVDEKDLTEGHITAVTYHYSNTTPMVVMAGKFTRTLRTEYEAAHNYRSSGKSAKSVSVPMSPAKTAETSEKQSETKRKNAADISKTRQKSAVSSPLTKQKAKKKSAESTVVPAGKVQSDKNKVLSKKKKNIPLIDLELYEEIPENESVQPSANKKHFSKSDKQKLAKEKKEKKKIRLRDIFGSEEEFDPDDIEASEHEPKPQLDDYNEEKDAEAIKTEISTNFQSVFVRVFILLGAVAASIILSLIAQCTELFSVNIRNGWLWFAIISFLLLATAIIVSRNPIVNGIMPLRRFRGNSDTAVAAASVAAVMQSVTALLTPDVYTNGTMYLYTPLVILALFCNAVGKLLIITRTHYNFNFLIKPYPKYAGKIFTDKQNAEKMTRELPIRKPLIAHTRRAKFMSNFLQLSYAPDPSEKLAAMLAPWTTVFSLICGIIYGIMNRSFIGGISSFALTASMSVPMMALLSINIPLRRLCKSSLRSGAMITSYETVKQFSDTNAIMIDSSQLYPKGSVTLSGMRSFKQSKLNDALQSGAAIMNAVNGTMVHIFENIVQCSKNDLPKVDNVIYEDGRGIVGWVKDQRVLIGNRELLEAHNIVPPEKEMEDKYIKRGEDILYISVGGDLIAMFMLSYKTNKNVANELRSLEQSGVNFIIRTVDPNLTREKVAERFGLFFRCITILPTGLGNICHEAMTKVDERSRAYLVTRGNISSFAKVVSGCIKMKFSVTLSKIFQCLSVGSALLIVTMMSFVGGFEKLGCLEMLIFIGFWLLASIIVSLIKK